MSQTQTLVAKRLKRREQAAKRQIAAFEKAHGSAHGMLLCQAAFPLALTPDLLYRLWANFQRDTRGQFLSIPWIAVSDILLSSFCQEVGENLFELDPAVRNTLINQLQNHPDLGQQRIQEISDFLLEYTQQQLQSDDVDIRDFAESQRWTALAYTQPEKVAQDIAFTFQQIGADTVASAQPNSPAPNKPELVRMASLVKTLSAPLTTAKLEPLLIYAQGMEQWAKGNVQKATDQLAQVTDVGKIQIAGVDLPIPDGTGLEISPAEGDGQSIASGQEDVRDFSGQRLRGRSFRGQMLAGANFSKADLRGADFAHANLTGADFSQAQMGLQRRWVFVLIVPTLLLSVLSGLMAALVGMGGWGVVLSAFVAHANQSLTIEFAFMLVGCALGFGIFLWLCRMTLHIKLTASLSAGALAGLGAVWLAVAMLSLIFAGVMQAEVLGLPIFISPGLTFFLAIALAWFVSRKATGRGTIGTALLLATSFAISFLFGGSFLFVVSLVLMTMLVVLWGIWLSYRCHRLSRTLLFTLLLSLVPGVVFTIAMSLSASADAMGAISVLLIFALVAMPLMIPFVFAGTLSPRGATAGLFVSLGALIVCTLLVFMMFVWFSESVVMMGLLAAVSSIALAVFGWVTAISVAITLAIVWAESNSKALTLSLPLLGITQLILSAVVFIVIFSRWIPATELSLFSFVFSIGVGVLLASMIVSLGIYVFWQAIQQDEQFISVRDLAIAFTARGSTNFSGANLTGANFTAATVKNANFIDAILTNVRWFHAQRFNTARFNKGSHLQSAKAQWLVTSGLGNHQNFDALTLKNINLKSVNLSDSSFINTDLSSANLKEANLSRAKLINTNLDQANLFGACLTGAYVSDITITHQTNLRGIDCQYIFTQFPTLDNPDPHRIPTDHRKIFKPGEFAQLMRQQFLSSDKVPLSKGA